MMKVKVSELQFFSVLFKCIFFEKDSLMLYLFDIEHDTVIVVPLILADLWIMACQRFLALYFIAESFIGADGKKKRRTKRGDEEIIESDFEYEIVSLCCTRVILGRQSESPKPVITV